MKNLSPKPPIAEAQSVPPPCWPKAVYLWLPSHTISDSPPAQFVLFNCCLPRTLNLPHQIHEDLGEALSEPSIRYPFYFNRWVCGGATHEREKE